MRRLFLLFGILLGLIACQDSIDEPPQILGMSIPGIPPQNITIDQQQRVITVLLPNTLPSPELVPTFTLSRQAQLPPYWTAEKRTISLDKYCPCGGYASQQSASILELVTRVDNQNQTSSYTIRLNGSGPLRLKPLQTPIIYDLKGTPEIVVPVENYYTNSLVWTFSVTRTGSATPNFRIFGCICSRQNEIRIPLSGYIGTATLKPGLHDLDLWLMDGTQVHVEGYILVQ